MGNRKYLVRVQQIGDEKKKIRRVQNDGKTIIMEKEKSKHPGWKFVFSRESVHPTRRFGIIWPTIDVLYHAPKAVEWDLEGRKVEMPHWDKDTSHNFITSQLIKALSSVLGEGMEKLANFLVITIFLLIILMAILGYGFWKIGVFR